MKAVDFTFQCHKCRGISSEILERETYDNLMEVIKHKPVNFTCKGCHSEKPYFNQFTALALSKAGAKAGDEIERKSV